MATAAKAKQLKVKQTKPKVAEDSLESVYGEIVRILQRHAPPFRTDGLRKDIEAAVAMGTKVHRERRWI